MDVGRWCRVLPLVQVMVLEQRSLNNGYDVTIVIMMKEMMVDRSPRNGCQYIASGKACLTRVVILVIVVTKFVVFVVVVS